MKKTGVTLLLTALTGAINTTASAHSGIEHSSVIHSLLHLATATGISVTLMLAGLYLFKYLPKARKLRVRTKK